MAAAPAATAPAFARPGRPARRQTAWRDPNSWFGYNDETDKVDNSLISFVPGPGNPPYGNGSAQITVNGCSAATWRPTSSAGTALVDIKQI